MLCDSIWYQTYFMQTKFAVCVNPPNMSNGYFSERRFIPEPSMPDKNLRYLLTINHLLIQQTAGCLTISKTESQNQTKSHSLAVAHRTPIHIKCKILTRFVFTMAPANPLHQPLQIYYLKSMGGRSTCRVVVCCWMHSLFIVQLKRRKAAKCHSHAKLFTWTFTSS